MTQPIRETRTARRITLTGLLRAFAARFHRDEPLDFARDERGISLPEELVSIAVLALSVGLVVVGIYTASVGTKVRHARVNATTLARSQMELVLDGSYSPDPTAVPYPTVAPVSGYTVNVGVEYWTAPSGPFTSTLRNDGLQRVTVSVSDAGGQILALEGYVVNR